MPGLGMNLSGVLLILLVIGVAVGEFSEVGMVSIGGLIDFIATRHKQVTRYSKVLRRMKVSRMKKGKLHDSPHVVSGASEVAA